jgi:hypothetical protein
MSSQQQGHWGKFADCQQNVQSQIMSAKPAFVGQMEAGLALLRKAERFYLPNGSDILQEKEIEPLKRFFRSPFGVVAILHEISIRNPIPGWPDKIWSITVGASSRPDDSDTAASDTVVLFSFNQEFSGGHPVWAVTPYTCVMRFDAGPGMGIFLVDGPEAHALLAAGASISKLVTEFMEDAQAWMNLCLLCNVQNTATVKIEAPEKLNRARIKSGKDPFHSYRVLQIGGERWDSPYVSEGQGAGRRSHLRRGHIRHIQDGRLTWVRDTIVKGSKPGFVHKDYVVAA